MEHLTQEQYTKVADVYRQIQIDNETVYTKTTSPALIENAINLFYEPSNYWLWHPDPHLVEAIEEVLCFGIGELVE